MFYVPAYYPNVLSQQQALPVAVGVGAEVRGIDIHLFKLARPPSVRVRGKVTGVPPDSPIVVSVSLLPADGGPFGGGNTVARPPDYAFDLSVPPGQYTIFGNVYSGGPEAYGTGVLTVTGDVAGVVLAMSPAPEVTGRISLAESGAKVNLQGVRVALTRLSSSARIRSAVRRRGQVRLPQTGFARPLCDCERALHPRWLLHPGSEVRREGNLLAMTSRYQPPHSWKSSSATPPARSPARYWMPTASRFQVRALH